MWVPEKRERDPGPNTSKENASVVQASLEKRRRRETPQQRVESGCSQYYCGHQEPVICPKRNLQHQKGVFVLEMRFD